MELQTKVPRECIKGLGVRKPRYQGWVSKNKELQAYVGYEVMKYELQTKVPRLGIKG